MSCKHEDVAWNNPGKFTGRDISQMKMKIGVPGVCRDCSEDVMQWYMYHSVEVVGINAE